MPHAIVSLNHLYSGAGLYTVPMIACHIITVGIEVTVREGSCSLVMSLVHKANTPLVQPNGRPQVVHVNFKVLNKDICCSIVPI